MREREREESRLPFTYIIIRALFSQSPSEEAPVSLSQSPPLFLLFHPSISARLTPQAGVPRQQTRRANWPPHRFTDRFTVEVWSCVKAPPALGGLLSTSARSRCLIPSLLIYLARTYSCSSGLDSKQIAGVEGL